MYSKDLKLIKTDLIEILLSFLFVISCICGIHYLCLEVIKKASESYSSTDNERRTGT